MQEESAQGRNAARSAATRRALIDAAKQLFIEKGYASTGTPEIVKLAGTTRGALYHHFDGKEGLFRAVLVNEANFISEEIRTAATEGKTPLGGLMSGTRAYFAAMQDPGRQRLMLRDGPSVLCAEELSEIDEQAGMGGLSEGLKALLGSSVPDKEVLDAISEILSAGFDRAVQKEKSIEHSVAAFRFIFSAFARLAD